MEPFYQITRVLQKERLDERVWDFSEKIISASWTIGQKFLTPSDLAFSPMVHFLSKSLQVQ